MGLLYEGDKQGCKAVGLRVGLLGVPAVAWVMYSMLPAAESGARAAWMSADGLAILTGLTGSRSAVLVVTTMVSATSGHWLAGRMWERSGGGDAREVQDRGPTE